MLQFFRLQFFEKQEEKFKEGNKIKSLTLLSRGGPRIQPEQKCYNFFVFNFFEAIEKHQTKIKKDNKIKSLTLLSRSGPRMQPKQKIHQKNLPQFFLLQSLNLKKGFKASWNGQIWPPHFWIICFRTFLDICSTNNLMCVFTKKFRTFDPHLPIV